MTPAALRKTLLFGDPLSLCLSQAYLGKLTISIGNRNKERFPTGLIATAAHQRVVVSTYQSRVLQRSCRRILVAKLLDLSDRESGEDPAR